ncbi:zinc finger, CCHC-type containing protein [Tanacetum coccineum]
MINKEDDECLDQAGGECVEGNDIQDGMGEKMMGGSKESEVIVMDSEVIGVQVEDVRIGVVGNDGKVSFGSVSEDMIKMYDRTSSDNGSKRVEFQGNKDIPTKIDENGVEVVVFDDVMVAEGSKRWELTLCGFFVGYRMSINELRYNLKRMWSKFGFKDIVDCHNGVFFMKFHYEVDLNLDNTELDKIPLWVKLCNVPLEAWTVKGISALASRLGKPLVMDTITEYKCKSQSEHIAEFHKLVGDLAAIDTEKGDGGEGLYVRGRSGQRDMEHDTYSAWLKSQGRSNRLKCYICPSEEHFKRDCPRYNYKKFQQVYSSGADGYDSADVMMAISIKELLDWIMDSRGSYHITYMRDYLVDFEECDCDNVLLGDGRECRVQGMGKVQVQMRDGSSFMLNDVRYVSELRQNLILLGTLEKEGFTVKMQSGKIKVINGSLVVLSGTRRANCVYTLDSQVVTRKTLKGRKQFGEYQTGWKIKMGNVLDFCNQRIMGFNESGEYKKKFIGSGVGTGSVQVLQGVEFEVELQEDHTFEVEPHGNVNHVAGSQEVISKWKAGLKDDMDARSDMYVLNNGCRKCSDDNDSYYWEYTPEKGNILGMEIVRNQRGNTLRVSQSRFYNEKLIQTLLEGHSILSLEGSLLGDCDVEKNGKCSCIYAVGSQVYQMVCTRLDIASADVGMWDKFDRGLQTDV